jgi:hypothetical protein
VIFDVVQVVLKFFDGVFDAGAIRVAYLCPAGYAGFDDVAAVVIGNLFAQLIDKKRTFRARPDKAHLPHEHVEQLRQFVNTYAADKASDTRGAVIVLAGPARLAVLFGIAAHAAKFQDGE